MTGLANLIRRDRRLFFKDKGMLISSLITPVVLLVLYATFLASIYRDSFVSALPQGFPVADALIDATVGGELISSLLAVSCVTVAFCSNLMMVQDKVSGALRDLTVSPVRRSTVALAYFIASALVTLIVTFVAFGASLLYLWRMGWYLTFGDVARIALDVFLLTLFGVALSSCVNFPLSTNGQASAVGTIVSAGYGFICGAYMPISQFNEGLRNVIPRDGAHGLPDGGHRKNTRRHRLQRLLLRGKGRRARDVRHPLRRDRSSSRPVCADEHSARQKQEIRRAFHAEN